MHPNTLQRISDSEMYGNQYTLATFMSDLKEAIFKVDINGNVNTFRQNLQAAYVERLIKMVKEGNTNRFVVPAKSMAVYQLQKLKKQLRNPKGDIASVAHKTHLKTKIENTLKAVN